MISLRLFDILGRISKEKNLLQRALHDNGVMIKEVFEMFVVVDAYGQEYLNTMSSMIKSHDITLDAMESWTFIMAIASKLEALNSCCIEEY